MSRSAARSRRCDLAVLLVGSALLFGLGLGARDLWNPNEPIYGQAVVEMARQGNWLVPTVNGEVFAEKPILYFWAARLAALATGGVREWSLRLPSVAAGVAAVLLVYLLVLPYAGPPRARIAAGLLATTFIVFWSARSIQMDLLLAAAVLASVLAATRVVDHAASARLGWLLAGAAAGLGLLAKGPLGLICPALVLATYLAATRRLRTLRPGRLLLALGAAAAVAGPWFAALALRGRGDVLYEVVVRQNFGRFVDPWDHSEPWWYFLLYFWIDMAPWAWLVPLAAGLPGRGDAQRRLDRLAWSWIAVLLVFFSLSASKRSAYILPLAPAVAVLVSGLAERLATAELEAWRRRALDALLGVVALLLFGVAGYLLIAGPARFPLLAGSAVAVGLVALAGGAAILLGLVLPFAGRAAAPAALGAFTLTLYVVAAALVLPAIDPYKSPRPFCDEVRERVGPQAPLRSYRQWRFRAGYVYYMGRGIPRIETPRELLDYWSRPERVFLIVQRDRLEEVQGLVGPVEPLVRRPIGGNEAFLLANR